MFWNHKIKVKPEQEKSIPELKDKWEKIAFSTQSIKGKIVTTSLNSIYQYLGYSSPKIIYFASPYQAASYLLNQLFQELDSTLISNLQDVLMNAQDLMVETEIIDILVNKIITYINPLEKQTFGENIKHKIQGLWSNQLDEQKLQKFDKSQVDLWEQQLRNTAINQEINNLNSQYIKFLEHQLLGLLISQLLMTQEIKNQKITKVLTKFLDLIENQTTSKFVINLGNKLAKNLFVSNGIYPEILAIANSRFQFYGEVLKIAKDAQLSQTFNDLLANCGWFFPFSKVCLICDRPTQLSLDQQHRLHQEGEMAMLYNDSYGIYAHHGVILPKNYGSKHPSQWKAKWLLTENNAELRRILIQGIGYERLCQELNALTIDIWREYTLLSFPDLIDPIDQQPIYLLKMICPSTKFIHALRVPPHFTSAKEAITWVNWDIDPEDIVAAS